MTDLHSFVNSSSPTAAHDAFEDGWDRGVEWASEQALYADLVRVQLLQARRCADLDCLLKALSASELSLFGDGVEVSRRHVEGFIDGAVASLRDDAIPLDLIGADLLSHRSVPVATPCASIAWPRRRRPVQGA